MLRGCHHALQKVGLPPFLGLKVQTVTILVYKASCVCVCVSVCPI